MNPDQMSRTVDIEAEKEVDTAIQQSATARKKRQHAEMTDRMLELSREILIHRNVDVEKALALASDHVFRCEIERKTTAVPD